MNDYRGIFYGEDVDHHYYEGGAHFRYKDLYEELKMIKKKEKAEERKNEKTERNNSYLFLRTFRNPSKDKKGVSVEKNKEKATSRNQNNYFSNGFSKEKKAVTQRKIHLRNLSNFSVSKASENSNFCKLPPYKKISIRNINNIINSYKDKKNAMNRSTSLKFLLSGRNVSRNHQDLSKYQTSNHFGLNGNNSNKFLIKKNKLKSRNNIQCVDLKKSNSVQKKGGGIQINGLSDFFLTMKFKDKLYIKKLYK